MGKQNNYKKNIIMEIENLLWNTTMFTKYNILLAYEVIIH